MVVECLLRAAGKPEFQTMKQYIPKGLNMKHLGLFMNKTFSGRLTEAKIGVIREKWQGNLIVKGIVNPDDAEIAVKHGLEGLIVSNHGGRQLDASLPPAETLAEIVDSVGADLTVMADSGVETGVDIARSEVRLPNGPIRNLGEFEVTVHVHEDINAKVKVFVISDSASE